MNSNDSNAPVPGQFVPDLESFGFIQAPSSPLPVGNCSEAFAALFTYLDGALTDERRGVIQTHLDDCAPCFSAYEFHIELRAVVQQRCQTVLPAGLKERIFLEVAREQGGSQAD